MENQEIEQKNQELFAELAKYPQGSKEYRDIASKIIANNMGLVKTIARKYFVSKTCPTINDDDLISAGYLGVLNAIKAFDPAKGSAFGAFAGRCIENKIFQHFRAERRHKMPSLEDSIGQEDEEKLGDVVASPIKVEDDFIEKAEKQRQMTWLRANLDRLPQKQREVLTAKYLSGEVSLRGNAFAKQFQYSRQYISLLEKAGIASLQKMSGVRVNLPQETPAEKIKTKAVLKDLILAELPPIQKKAMLCKFYSPTQKSDEQVAQEIESTKSNVRSTISQSCKKLCTLCVSVKNIKHLKSILEFSPEETVKEC